MLRHFQKLKIKISLRSDFWQSSENAVGKFVAIWGKGISTEEKNKLKCPEVEEFKACFKKTAWK